MFVSFTLVIAAHDPQVVYCWQFKFSAGQSSQYQIQLFFFFFLFQNRFQHFSSSKILPGVWRWTTSCFAWFITRTNLASTNIKISNIQNFTIKNFCFFVLPWRITPTTNTIQSTIITICKRIAKSCCRSWNSQINRSIGQIWNLPTESYISSPTEKFKLFHLFQFAFFLFLLPLKTH